ncbi:prephenate dehydrogenase [Methanothermobacter sp.]|uniref:prephenate dehydrogenase n=1 Tax=Methanothermobacter sp. TaxID=1884223 RepID=UPI003C785CD0
MIVSIIGGTRGLGYWIARFLKREGLKVIITGRDHDAGMEAASKIGVEYCGDNVQAASRADVVVVSVPIDVTADVIREVAPHVREGGLLMDVTSVKEEPARVMEESIGDGAHHLPAHPMFGPRVSSLEGQVVVLTPTKENPWVDTVIEFLEKHKARVIVTDPATHDRMMSVVQVLTHFAYISIASTLEAEGVDIRESRKFASPIYNLMIDTIARIVAQNPYLAYSIQTHNPHGQDMRDSFLRTASELNEMLSAGRMDEFVSRMGLAAKNIDDVEASLGRSDKAIEALNEELKILKDSVGAEVGLRHIYSGKVHVGVLESVTPDYATLREGKRVLSFKISNIMVLSDEELQRWKAENLSTRVYDISAVFPDTVDPHVIEYLTGLLDGVAGSEVVDVYSGPQIPAGHVSLTLRIHVFQQEDYQRVREILEGMGARIR